MFLFAYYAVRFTFNQFLTKKTRSWWKWIVSKCYRNWIVWVILIHTNKSLLLIAYEEWIVLNVYRCHSRKPWILVGMPRKIGGRLLDVEWSDLLWCNLSPKRILLVLHSHKYKTEIKWLKITEMFLIDKSCHKNETTNVC